MRNGERKMRNEEKRVGRVNPIYHELTSTGAVL